MTLSQAIDLLLSWSAWLLFLGQILALVSVPSVLLERRGQPLAAMGWLFALLVLPWVGLLSWWTVGRFRLHRRRRHRSRASAKLAPRLARLRTTLVVPPQHDRALLPVRRLPKEVADSVFPPTSHNRADLLVDGPEVFAAMEKAIREARHHIHSMFYIWRNDQMGRAYRDLLVERAEDGIEVRAMFDDLGTTLRGPFLKPLLRAGAKVVPFLPVRWFGGRSTLNFRNHRKLLIVDGQRAFVGGINIGDEYATTWHDLAVTLQGPALDQLQEVFADDWFFSTGEDVASSAYFGQWALQYDGNHGHGAGCAVIASGPDAMINPLHDILFAAISGARERIWLTSPYFVPGSAMLVALRVAVYRGVDVRLMLPQKSDVPLVHRAARAFYPELLRSGVRIFEYKPAVMHAKAMVIDDELCFVGSANMDSRSFRFNFETVCLVSDRGLNHALADVFAKDQGRSHEIEIAPFERRAWTVKVVDSALHLLSPVL